MKKDTKQNDKSRATRALGKFEQGGDSGAIEDPKERERRLNALSPDQQELAKESARLADLCLYFSTQKMDIPHEILERIGALSKLFISERVPALKDINRDLMEYLNDVGEDSGIRQQLVGTFWSRP